MPSTSKLDHFSYCRFLTSTEQTWTTDHWRARDIVRAIKGETFGGYVELKIKNTWHTIDAAHPQVAYDWFADRVAAETSFDSKTTFYLCPIPDSECTVSAARPSKTMRLAEILVARIPALEIWDGIRFRRKMPKSRESNMRNEAVLFEALHSRSHIPSGCIILLDDVCTTGAHARAAARTLKRGGAGTVCSMSVARTMLDPNEQVFGLRVDAL